MSPNQKCNIWDFNNETQEVRVITLTAWSLALKSEIKGAILPCGELAPIVRKFLSAPVDYPIDQLSEHLSTSLKDIQEQLGIK